VDPTAPARPPPRRCGAALVGSVDALTLRPLGVGHSALVGSLPRGAGGGARRALGVGWGAGPAAAALGLVAVNAGTLRVLDGTADADDASRGVEVEAAARRAGRLSRAWCGLRWAGSGPRAWRARSALPARR